MELDVAGAIEQAKKAAAEGDAQASIASLLEAWRTSPAPAFADAIERLTQLGLPPEPPAWEEALDDPLETGRLIDRLREGNAATAVGLIAQLRVAKDPRVAGACVRLLEDPPWHATGSQPFWTKLFALLVANADPRAVQRLETIDYGKIINGRSMRGWMTDKVAKTVVALEKELTGASVVKLSKDQTSALAKIEPSPGKIPARVSKPKAKDSEAELLRAVYEAPFDDAPRMVLADYWLERGDPRGELISLQLSPSEAGDKRALALIRKHQKAWLGPIAPFVKYLAYPSVAADDPGGIAMWWRRGFVAGCIVSMTRPKMLELGGLPIWSTVERISGLRIAAKDWAEGATRLLTAARGLRSLVGPDVKLLQLATGIPRLRTQLERVAMPVRNDDIVDLASALGSLEGLRKLELKPHYNEPPALGPLLDSPVIERLTKLTFEIESKRLVLERATPREPFAVHLTEPQARLLEIAEHLTANGIPASAGLQTKTKAKTVVSPRRSKAK